MCKDKTPVRVSYYRTDERTESGELIFFLQFYGANGRLQKTVSVPASRLMDQLNELRKKGISSQRVV